MFLTNRSLDRRTFLRGMGATVALPLLDAMIPARTLLASSAVSPVPRLAFVYFPHGAVMDEWTPAGAGRDFQLGRILAPLAPYRNRLTVVSGLENRHAYGPVHTITPGTWLSGSSPRLRRGLGAASPPREKQDEVSAGTTADQLAADHVGRHTPLASLVVAAEQPKRICAGIWEGEYRRQPQHDDLVSAGTGASADGMPSASGVRHPLSPRGDGRRPHITRVEIGERSRSCRR